MHDALIELKAKAELILLEAGENEEVDHAREDSFLKSALEIIASDDPSLPRQEIAKLAVDLSSKLNAKYGNQYWRWYA